MAIVLCKTTNEYFLYLFEPWSCIYNKSNAHGETYLQFMYATVLRQPCSTKSFRNTGLNFRLNWPAMANTVFICPVLHQQL